MSERAIIIIDKDGVVQYAKVTNINRRPPLEDLIGTLEALDHSFESKECE
jgi:peroxiredoxin